MNSTRLANDADNRIWLAVLGRFDLRRASGDTLLPALTLEAQHLLALLALKDRRVSRSAIAGTLWPDASETHAYASLRSALSRLTALAHDAVVITHADLELSALVTVDLHEARQLAHDLLQPAPVEFATRDIGAGAIATLSLDCLPDWYDEWVLGESEAWRQLRLHALDALARGFSEAQRFGDAIAAALAAVQADPLRESAWSTLMGVHLAEGNESEAIRAFEQYRDLVMSELHIEPTPGLRALLAGHDLP